MNPLVSSSESSNSCTPIIVALDFPDEAQTLNFVSQLEPHLCRLKVGKELFTATGRQLIEKLVSRGFDVFLDLKYHDIPNTVASACRVAADLGVWMIDMHASGGRRMMEAASSALAQCTQRPLLIGVTVLTSLDEADLAELGWPDAPIQVMRLAHLAQDSGLDGVVCSAHEARSLRAVLGANFRLVTPGIRLDTTEADDQRRVMTPKQALTAGADYLVIGRPITRAESPREVLEQICADLGTRSA